MTLNIFRMSFMAFLVISCAQKEVKDTFERFVRADRSGSACVQSFSKMPLKGSLKNRDFFNSSQVKKNFNQCLSSYSSLKTHAQALEFFKGAFEELQIPFEIKSKKDHSSLHAILGEEKNSRNTVVLYHPTRVINGLAYSKDNNSKGYLWGQKEIDIKAMGIFQLVSVIMLKMQNIDLKNRLVFIAADHADLKPSLSAYSNIKVVLNETGYSFQKDNRKVFLLGTEQKGGAWLKVTHKDPAHLMAHLDQLLAVYKPHQPRAYNGPSMCQLMSVQTPHAEINKLPRSLDLEISCDGVSDADLLNAFKDEHILVHGHRSNEKFKISLKRINKDAHHKEKASVLQLAVQGLQKLSIVPYRDWSFKEPKFYQSQQTPASLDFNTQLASLYQKSKQGSGARLPASKNGNLEMTKELFRTTCSWTGLQYAEGKAEALVDCRLLHTKSLGGSQPKYFIEQLRSQTTDPDLKFSLLKGWDYSGNGQNTSVINVIKSELKRSYPGAFISSWISPNSAPISTGDQETPSYGVFPVMVEDFISGESRSRDFVPEAQINMAVQTYTAIVKKLVITK